MLGRLLQILGLVIVFQGLLYGLWMGGESAMLLELALTAVGALLFVSGRALAKRESS